MTLLLVHKLSFVSVTFASECVHMRRFAGKSNNSWKWHLRDSNQVENKVTFGWYFVIIVDKKISIFCASDQNVMKLCDLEKWISPLMKLSL